MVTLRRSNGHTGQKTWMHGAEEMVALHRRNRHFCAVRPFLLHSATLFFCTVRPWLLHSVIAASPMVALRRSNGWGDGGGGSRGTACSTHTGNMAPAWQPTTPCFADLHLKVYLKCIFPYTRAALASQHVYSPSAPLVVERCSLCSICTCPYFAVENNEAMAQQAKIKQ